MISNQTFILLKNNIRVYVSDVTKIAQEAIDLHNTTPLPSIILASSLAIFGPLGIIKNYGKVSIEIKCDGPIKSIIVDTNSKGQMRALVGDPGIITEYDDFKFNDIPLQLAIGQKGILKIVHSHLNQNFGGQVNLVKGDLVTDLAYYFHQSEQIYSAIQSSIILASPKKVKRAYSAIFQLLPNHEETDVELIRQIINDKTLAKSSDLQDYINKIKFKIIAKYDLEWKCSCSEQKISEILQTITQAEKEAIIKKYHKLEVRCNFCNKKYDFTKRVLN